MNETDIAELERQINADYQADVAAIRRVRRLLRERKIVAANGAAGFPEVLSPEESAKLSIEARVLNSIEAMKGEFTLADLVTFANELGGPEVNRKTVSSILYRQRNKAVRVVKEGRGRKLALYEKI